jgi:hypothetical protein
MNVDGAAEEKVLAGVRQRFIAAKAAHSCGRAVDWRDEIDRVSLRHCPDS